MKKLILFIGIALFIGFYIGQAMPLGRVVAVYPAYAGINKSINSKYMYGVTMQRQTLLPVPIIYKKIISNDAGYSLGIMIRNVSAGISDEDWKCYGPPSKDDSKWQK